MFSLIPPAVNKCTARANGQVGIVDKDAHGQGEDHMYKLREVLETKFSLKGEILTVDRIYLFEITRKA